MVRRGGALEGGDDDDDAGVDSGAGFDWVDESGGEDMTARGVSVRVQVFGEKSKVRGRDWLMGECAHRRRKSAESRDQSLESVGQPYITATLSLDMSQRFGFLRENRRHFRRIRTFAAASESGWLRHEQEH